MSAAGQVNAHTHLYSGLVPFGMPEPRPAPENFVQILDRVWWKLDRALDPDSLRASARWYLAEARRLGTVGLIDHHESPNLIEGSLDILADACQEAGMPAVLCYGVTERNGGRAEARRGLAECRRFIENNPRPLVRGVIGLHASFTVSDETLREAATLCRDLKSVMHVHVAEDLADVADAQRRGWAGPLERLTELGALPPGSIIAHGVHLDASQVRRCEQMGCWLVQNTRSNRGNWVGYPTALQESRHVALGSDGYPSDMVAEQVALLEDVPRYGDSMDAAVQRAVASHALLAERFGGSVPAMGAGTGMDIKTLRSEATAQAARLWERMAKF
ncbi:MAG: amidohydrolase family protein [Comamonadaceae bacterium]